MSGTRLAFMRPFTTRLVNPLTLRVAGHLPWFGIIVVPGRRSGRIRRVPMNVFREENDYVMALTYGRDVDWVKNVLAAQGCRLETQGRMVELRHPELIRDPSRSLVPRLVSLFLAPLGVNDFLRLRPSSTGN